MNFRIASFSMPFFLKSKIYFFFYFDEDM